MSRLPDLRRVHRAVPALVGDERVRARVHEHVEGIYVPAPRGEQHGRLARVGSIVHHRRRRALGRAKQHLHHRVCAALRGEVKWGLPVVANHTHPRALVEQQLHHASVLAHRRQVQRGVPEDEGLVEVNNLTRVVFRRIPPPRRLPQPRTRPRPRPRLVRGQSRALLDRDDPVPGVAYEHAGRGRVPAIAAMCIGVNPASVRRVESTPLADRSASTTAVDPPSAARCKGVAPDASMGLGSAPGIDRRCSTSSRWHPCAAR